ncbi:unnamed protein product [Dibothriocephalus latus]|uniref:DNA-directed DNA polymerase n=1 Tax=Dibothriocephalus latus TaxID=60516 RepID=A0A3P7P4X4_DIBLA|nr:unnamed protein product [Dibothriocephalus latus]
MRTARRLNFLLPSPNVVQRARQRAPEALPLNLEPISGLHADGPVVVLDFQSLYPSVAIAYNYCFSTCLGRLSSLEKGIDGGSFTFGCLEQFVTPEDLQLVGDYVTIAPNGVCFVKREILEGVLPRLWRGLLSSRLMVKDSMKLYTGDEVGDSIVHKGRETLERAIQLVETGEGVLPGTPTPWLAGGSCNAKVIYGDTDSLFVKLSHCDKATSFRLGQAIADAVSQANPAPIKLKLEKVFFPCLLEAKKRYVGYAYESAEQVTPVFDAKGIETVRRDSAPFVGKVLESSLRLLFDQFRVWDMPPG